MIAAQQQPPPQHPKASHATVQKEVKSSSSGSSKESKGTGNGKSSAASSSSSTASSSGGMATTTSASVTSVPYNISSLPTTFFKEKATWIISQIKCHYIDNAVGDRIFYYHPFQGAVDITKFPDYLTVCNSGTLRKCTQRFQVM